LRAASGVPLVLVQYARVRKVNDDVIIRQRPRQTVSGFDIAEVGARR
jgi:sporulation protein YlmC with PRC-barrel domain